MSRLRYIQFSKDDIFIMIVVDVTRLGATHPRRSSSSRCTREEGAEISRDHRYLER